MIVKVRAKDGPNLTIPIPTALLCSRLTAGLSAKMMAQNGVHATPEQMVRFFRAARQYKRKHPRLGHGRGQKFRRGLCVCKAIRTTTA